MKLEMMVGEREAEVLGSWELTPATKVVYRIIAAATASGRGLTKAQIGRLANLTPKTVSVAVKALLNTDTLEVDDGEYYVPFIRKRFKPLN